MEAPFPARRSGQGSRNLPTRYFDLRPAEKSAPGSTAEKVRRVPGDAPEARWDAAAQYLIEASE